MFFAEEMFRGPGLHQLDYGLVLILIMLLGHWIGEKLNDPAAQRKIHEFKEVIFALGILAACGFVLFILWRRRHLKELHDAEQRVVEKVVGAEMKVAETIAHAAGRVVKKPHADRAARMEEP